MMNLFRRKRNSFYRQTFAQYYPRDGKDYLLSPDNSHCHIFVNYHKEEDISESTKYEDKFLNTKELDWMSKSNRKINSNDVQSILGKKGPIRLPLFIKKKKR